MKKGENGGNGGGEEWEEEKEGVLAGLFLVIFLSGPVGPAPQNFSGPDKETAGPVLCSPIVVFYSGWYVLIKAALAVGKKS